MTFIAPWWLAAGVLSGAAVVALHFLARQRPRAAAFPTARFVPDVPARAPSRAVRPADLLLLVVRVLVVLALATAMAGPVPARSRRLARVVAVDVSRAVKRLDEARDSARGMLREGDALVLFDSAAHRVPSAGPDPVEALTLTGAGARGSLSAALVAARRAGSVLGRRFDSVELVIVSPLVLEEWDEATAAVRAEWPGPARLVPVTAADQPPWPEIVVRGADDDPLRATVTLLGRRAGPPTRVVRRAPDAEDSLWAAGGGTLVVWPADPEEAGTAQDSSGAVLSDGIVSVARFDRPDSPAPGGAVVARWADGAPAATERPLGSGCRRDIAIPIAGTGDYALRESTLRLVERLTSPCGGQPDVTPLSDAAITLFRGAGPLASGRALSPPAVARSGLTALLIGFCLLLLGLESRVRSLTAARAQTP